MDSSVDAGLNVSRCDKNHGSSGRRYAKAGNTRWTEARKKGLVADDIWTERLTRSRRFCQGGRWSTMRNLYRENCCQDRMPSKAVTQRSIPPLMTVGCRRGHTGSGLVFEIDEYCEGLADCRHTHVRDLVAGGRRSRKNRYSNYPNPTFNSRRQAAGRRLISKPDFPTSHWGAGFPQRRSTPILKTGRTE